jgi:hypothetical protein
VTVQFSSVQFSSIRVTKRNSSSGSMRTEQTGTRITEEYKRSACEGLKCEWKILYVTLVVI